MTSRSERGRDQGYCDHITYVDKVHQMLLHKKLSYFRGKTSLWSSRCIKAKKWRIMHHFESNLFLPNTWKLVLVLPNYFLILMDCLLLFFWLVWINGINKELLLICINIKQSGVLSFWSFLFLYTLFKTYHFK